MLSCWDYTGRGLGEKFFCRNNSAEQTIGHTSPATPLLFLGEKSVGRKRKPLVCHRNNSPIHYCLFLSTLYPLHSYSTVGGNTFPLALLGSKSLGKRSDSIAPMLCQNDGNSLSVLITTKTSRCKTISHQCFSSLGKALADGKKRKFDSEKT